MIPETGRHAGLNLTTPPDLLARHLPQPELSAAALHAQRHMLAEPLMSHVEPSP